jgi:histidinol-phosphate aminotransferase
LAVVEERAALFAALKAISWLRPYPSSANFILCAVEGGEGKALYEALARRGVFVRFYSSERLRGFVRFSVPRPDQHETLLERVRACGPDIGLA